MGDELFEIELPMNYRFSMTQLANRSSDFTITAPNGETLTWNTGEYVACAIIGYAVGIQVFVSTGFKPKIFEYTQKVVAWGCALAVKNYGTYDQWGPGSEGGGEAGGGGGHDDYPSNPGGDVIVLPELPVKTPGGYWQPVPVPLPPPEPPYTYNPMSTTPPIEESSITLRLPDSLGKSGVSSRIDELVTMSQVAGQQESHLDPVLSGNLTSLSGKKGTFNSSAGEPDQVDKAINLAIKSIEDGQLNLDHFLQHISTREEIQLEVSKNLLAQADAVGKIDEAAADSDEEIYFAVKNAKESGIESDVEEKDYAQSEGQTEYAYSDVEVTLVGTAELTV